MHHFTRQHIYRLDGYRITFFLGGEGRLILLVFPLCIGNVSKKIFVSRKDRVGDC